MSQSDWRLGSGMKQVQPTKAQPKFRYLHVEIIRKQALLDVPRWLALKESVLATTCPNSVDRLKPPRPRARTGAASPHYRSVYEDSFSSLTKFRSIRPLQRIRRLQSTRCKYQESLKLTRGNKPKTAKRGAWRQMQFHPVSVIYPPS